jgi:hypothetical protein
LRKNRFFVIVIKKIVAFGALTNFFVQCFSVKKLRLL